MRSTNSLRTVLCCFPQTPTGPAQDPADTPPHLQHCCAPVAPSATVKQLNL